MNVKFLNPFVEAACEVLKVEAKCTMQRGDLALEKSGYVTDDVTVILSLVGQVVGTVFYSMDQATAMRLVSQMFGSQMETFDGLAQSGIAELGNVITGQASIRLSDSGYASTISPPTLLCGKGAIISTLEYPRLVVPILTNLGNVVIHLALREIPSVQLNTAQIPIPQRPVI